MSEKERDSSSLVYDEDREPLQEVEEGADEATEEARDPKARSEKDKIKFNAKPLRDHGHMRHGPFQGADVGEESGALMCNFVWSLSKGGSRRLGGLIAALPRYGASHVASTLKSMLKEAFAGKAAAEGKEGLGPVVVKSFKANEGDRLATPEDFVKLNVDPAAAERFNAALADRNIDSLQIANPDGSMKFIIKAQDVDAVNRALDDIVGVPDKTLDEQHAVMEQARAFAKEEEKAEPQKDSVTVDVAALDGLVGESPDIDERIDEGKKDAAQRAEEHRQEQERESTRSHGREQELEQSRGRFRSRDSDPER